MLKLRIRIVGRVQGVGFRDFTVREARKLGVCGWVKNNSDGTVEASVHGEEDALKKLLTELKRGPRLSRVDQIETEPDDTTETFTSFSRR